MTDVYKHTMMFGHVIVVLSPATSIQFREFVRVQLDLDVATVAQFHEEVEGGMYIYDLKWVRDVYAFNEGTNDEYVYKFITEEFERLTHIFTKQISNS